ncbi:hypothetical protein COLO4_08703 [Corchorus olitorius]|uniref:Uncharacterized protein n=1 Tax=Corchorus olitorius TaxID=93759 RepID=A0A1R3KF12_9ROSI|nr:hypothetical protein COLO4_08703 [Corchorus olitorius]
MGFMDSHLMPSESIYGFRNKPIAVKGLIELPICLGDGENVIHVMSTFVVTYQLSGYNVVIGRPLMKIRMVESIYCLKVKSPTLKGVGHMRSSQVQARQCHLTSLIISKKMTQVDGEIIDLQEYSPEVEEKGFAVTAACDSLCRHASLSFANPI